MNANGTVYTPSSTVYPPVAATITADTVSTTTGTLYRGAVFYLPYGCNINDFIVDNGFNKFRDSKKIVLDYTTNKFEYISEESPHNIYALRLPAFT